ILCLPDEDEPELTIYRDIDDSWVVESRDGTRPAQEDESLFAGGRPWRLLLPTSVLDTRELDEMQLHDLELCFFVSRDGEHIELQLHSRHREPMILESRAHMALLLVLARARLGDIQQGVPHSEAGWIYRDELPRMLNAQPHMVNLWVHRARKQLAQQGLRDAATIIERRAAATQLRLSPSRLRVEDA
ncbi:MAG: FHA domain-containing protein, partial [Myxococcales bacterium]|nr:FHA domain-containing protein [Myxococcales bacterium]